jgi:hypothetical protein
LFTKFFSDICGSDDPMVSLSAQAPTQFRFPGFVHFVLELQHWCGLCTLRSVSFLQIVENIFFILDLYVPVPGCNLTDKKILNSNHCLVVFMFIPKIKRHCSCCVDN